MIARDATRLVYVPLIGFLPPGTRTLAKSAESTVDGTRLIVLAVAASPDRTDAVVEWERAGDPATCPPGSRILAYSVRAPLDEGVSASLLIGSKELTATAMTQRGYHGSVPNIGAIHALTFPRLPQEAGGAELQVREDAREWRVALTLGPSQIAAMPVAAKVERGGIVVRATAIARHEDQIIVELEVEAQLQIRQVAAPAPTPMRYAALNEEDHRLRVQELRRFFADQATPITLEDDRGEQVEEIGRLLPQGHEGTVLGKPFVSRFPVMFGAPRTGLHSAAVVVPFVELNDRQPSVTADLRELPLDLELGEHRFRVTAMEQHGADQRKIFMEIPPSTGAPRFVQPARLQGSDPAFAWMRHAVDRPSRDADQIWMATEVGDPPIVTFHGAVLRVDGPWRLELPSA